MSLECTDEEAEARELLHLTSSKPAWEYSETPTQQTDPTVLISVQDKAEA